MVVLSRGDHVGEVEEVGVDLMEHDICFSWEMLSLRYMWACEEWNQCEVQSVCHCLIKLYSVRNLWQESNTAAEALAVYKKIPCA